MAGAAGFDRQTADLEYRQDVASAILADRMASVSDDLMDQSSDAAEAARDAADAEEASNLRVAAMKHAEDAVRLLDGALALRTRTVDRNRTEAGAA